MATRDPQPIYRLTLTPQDLRTWAAPQFVEPNKAAIYEQCCRDGCQTEGELHVSRWPTIDETVTSNGKVTEVFPRSGGFAYAPADNRTAAWHANFANWDLFSLYADGPFAQDEIQALEHPALGGVREALLARELSTLVTDDGPQGPTPTPFTIAGVQRRAAIDTAPRDDDRWPHGLYGQDFWLAPEDVALEATTILDPPTISNIVAMEAPAMGRGRYSPGEIRFVLLAAASAFIAARVESQRLWPGRAVEVHTGHWGCGAYGGNPALTGAAQLLAARLAGLDRLVFWNLDPAAEANFKAAREATDLVLREAPDVALIDAVTLLDGFGFRWGASDGN
jgi:hypothetical protein